MPYILALDQGTTSSRAIVFDHDGAIVAVAQREFQQIFPRPGWVEHDPDEIWATQIGVAAEALGRARLRPRDIAAIGITNQRETTVVWDRETGAAGLQRDRLAGPAHRRLLRSAEAGRARGPHPRAHRPGHRRLLLRQQGRVDSRQRPRRARAGRGRRAGVRHDRQLAGLEAHERRDPRHRRDQRVAHDALQHPHAAVGRRPAEAAARAGQHAAARSGRRARSTAACRRRSVSGDVPIAGIAGDQQAALFGQMCVSPGLAKNTYGTGCFMLQNTGDRPVVSRNRLLTTVAWQVGGKTTYALEGSVFIGGAVVQWLRDGLGIIAKSADVERAGRVGAGQRRRLSRAGLRRPRRAALGPVRARHHRRHHARHDGRPHRPRGAREHRVPGRRPARRDAATTRESICRSCASMAARRPTTS